MVTLSDSLLDVCDGSLPDGLRPVNGAKQNPSAADEVVLQCISIMQVQLLLCRQRKEFQVAGQKLTELIRGFTVCSVEEPKATEHIQDKN